MTGSAFEIPIVYSRVPNKKIIPFSGHFVISKERTFCYFKRERQCDLFPFEITKFPE
jgi:hypothetical protein